METLTLAQLRQNPSAALRAVEHDGAEYTITNHGRPVARLVPLWRDGIASVEATARLFASITPDPVWAAELAADRASDQSSDPWAPL